MRGDRARHSCLHRLDDSRPDLLLPSPPASTPPLHPADLTRIQVVGEARPGLLTALTAAFRQLGLDVRRSELRKDADGSVHDVFYVAREDDGKALQTQSEKDDVRKQLLSLVRPPPGGRSAATLRGRPAPRADSTGTIVDATRQQEALFSLMDSYIKNDVLSIQQSIVNHVEYTLARSRLRFDDQEAYLATAHAVRDRLIEAWNDTNTWFKEEDPKRVYYLSMEYLQGRALLNALYNLDLEPNFREALLELGYGLETVAEREQDAALGNGGLGRLASCFLDSMATLDLPAWGYGIRYQYGMFRQSIVDGFQLENPDYWLTFGNPWEIQRDTVSYPVRYYGDVEVKDEGGRQMWHWRAGEEVRAVAYDNPIPGFATPNTINLRLWAAKPVSGLDLEAFNTGDYVQAILQRQRAETITSVLYPDDRTYEGKELRLRQQYFFTSASLQDVIRRFKERHSDWNEFPEKCQFQLNDTHPVIAVPELMRLLMDGEGLGWTKSWSIVTRVFSYTNHTVMPEALEAWDVRMVEKLLPRHMQIIYDLNWRFLESMKRAGHHDEGLLSRLSIISERYGQKTLHMANLACCASHTINGVAAIHSELIKKTVLKDFHTVYPEKFQNKTNGVTQRRWLAFCNPMLRELITETIGSDAWIRDLTAIRPLADRADDPKLQAKWRAIKRSNKERLAALVLERTGIVVSPDALFDVHVKRIHEYKRQLLNVYGVIDRYLRIKAGDKAVQPRVIMFGGKAAPGYDMAKRIIKLVSAVGQVVNNDPDVGDLLKVVFLPDYNVSSAEVIIPGTELSQHISTAGTEASGTSNMKFAMNGSLIIGTLDGATVEIAEEIGEKNVFLFGALADQVPRLQAERAGFHPSSRFRAVLDAVSSGRFGWADYFRPLVETVTGGRDHYLVANDFESYLEAQARVDAAYADEETWTRMSILSTAGCAKFSSDRTISEYAEDIWGVTPCRRPE